VLRIGIRDSKNYLLDTGPFLYLLLKEYNDNTERDVYSKEDVVADHPFDKDKAEKYWTFLSSKNVYITPHVLAEASNLIEGNNYNFDIGDVLTETQSFLLDQIDEKFVEKEVILDNEKENSLRIGVTDCGLQKLAHNSDLEFLLVYQDGDISHSAQDLTYDCQTLGTILTMLSEGRVR